ncbi:MAG: PP0621 family protein [Casimicrobiaceae bacterium]
MGKVIMWLVIVFAVLFVLRMINVAAAARKRRESAPPPPPGEGKALMVKCVECGVYLPKAEARRGPRGPGCGDDACRERAKQAR